MSMLPKSCIYPPGSPVLSRLVTRVRDLQRPASSFSGRRCDHDPIAHSDNVAAVDTTGASNANLTGTKVIELITDADTEWFNTFGANSNAEIAAIVNETEVLYQRELGLSIDIVEQNVFSSNSPYTSLDAATLLVQFRDYARTQHHLGTADLYHLFSTKNLGWSLGVAYGRVACRYTPNSPYSLLYGVSIYSGSITPNIVAHEIGHNLGATHDVHSPGSIMYPSVTRPPSVSTGFSAFSKQEIGDFLATYGSCFSPVGSTPQPTPSPTPSPAHPSLVLHRKRIKGTTYGFTGTLHSNAGKPLADQSINIVLGQTVAAIVTTNDLGQYAVKLGIKLKPGKSVKVHSVHTQSGMKSETLTIKRVKV